MNAKQYLQLKEQYIYAIRKGLISTRPLDQTIYMFRSEHDEPAHKFLTKLREDAAIPTQALNFLQAVCKEAMGMPPTADAPEQTTDIVPTLTEEELPKVVNEIIEEIKREENNNDLKINAPIEFQGEDHKGFRST